MSEGELCNKEIVILGRKIQCSLYVHKKGRHSVHIDFTDEHGNELGATMEWPNFIGKDKIA